MSDRTSPSLAILDTWLPQLRALPPTAERDHIVGEAEALRRAVDSFHMEAIRFRMYSVDRLLKQMGADDAMQRVFEDLRVALEAAGFHTRSH